MQGGIGMVDGPGIDINCLGPGDLFSADGEGVEDDFE